MDFELPEAAPAVSELASQMFLRHAAPTRLAEIERSPDHIDRVMWKEFAASGLLGLAVDPEYGGAGLGLSEVVLTLIEQGRHVALIPLWESVVLGAMAIAQFGDASLRQRWLPSVADGSVVLTAGLESTGMTAKKQLISGCVRAVPAGHLADGIIVAVEEILYLVDANQAGVARRVFERTDHALCADITLDDATAEPLDRRSLGQIEWLRERAWIGLAALQLGVSLEAVRSAAAHVSQREQFGVRLGTFQAVAHQIADCRIATDAMEVTLWNGVWRLVTGRPSHAAVHVARWWATDAGGRIARVVQHLYGGLGADVTYPIHRYLLWSNQLANTCGSAAWHLDQLSQHIASEAV